VESLGPANESAVDFLTTLGNKIAQQTGDERETAFLFQRLSVLVQRFNCVPHSIIRWPNHEVQMMG